MLLTAFLIPSPRIPQGFLHPLLDIDVPLCNVYLRPKYGRHWKTTAIRLLQPLLSRRTQSCFERLCSRPQHRPISTVREGDQERVHQILLDGDGYSASVADDVAVHGHQLDFPEASNVTHDDICRLTCASRHWPWVQSGYLTLHTLVSTFVPETALTTNI